MNAPQLRYPTKNFWTTRRLASTFAVLVLLAAFGVSGCNSTAPRGDTGSAAEGTGGAGANGPASNNPNVTVTRGTPAPGAAASTPMVLPASLRETSLKDIEGKTLKLSDYAGKVLVVNLWATWCGPCRMETPELVQLHKDYKSKGVEVIGLATEGNDPDLDKVKEFVKAQKVDYKVVYDEGSLANALVQMSHGRGVIPQSFIISGDGRIIGHFEGFSAIETPPKLRAVIDKALNERQG